MIKVLWHKVNNIEESVIVSALPKTTDISKIVNKLNTKSLDDNDVKRANYLGIAKQGSGHDCFLKGIEVMAVIEAPLYFWKQWDRYHFQDTISSTSTMHKILEQNLDEVLPNSVYYKTLERLELDIKMYKHSPDEATYQRIITNLPQGYLYTKAVKLNYLQIKSMYHQRKNHKLSEWRELCEWFKELKYAQLMGI